MSSELIELSFSRFHSSEVIPVQQIGNFMVVEMWHGPTGAFKDIAMVLVANLVNYFLGKRQEHATVLITTSGDTGPSAIHGVLGLDNMDIIVMYPKGSVSRVQELQMTTVDAENVTVFGGEGVDLGDFDALMKQIFGDAEFSCLHNLIGLNSINIGRIIIQAVHHFYAYLKACSSIGDEVIISIPTGACGHLASGVLAQQMGLPVKFIIGVNHNDKIHRCITTGSLQQPEKVIQSYASAMDIQIPYNIERVISFLSRNVDVADQFTQYDSTGQMDLTPSQLTTIQKLIWSTSVSQADILKTMQETKAEHDYLICPHTAVGIHAATMFCQSPDAIGRLLSPSSSLASTPIVCYATATLAKFKEVADKAGIPSPTLLYVDALYELPEKARLLKQGQDWESIIRSRIQEISAQRQLTA